MKPEDLFSAAAKSTNQAPMPDDDPLDDQAPPELIGGEWMDQLKTKGKDEEPRQILYNVDIALRFSPEWQGVLAYDEFKQKVRIVSAPPIDTRWPKDWSDEDDTKATIWMQEKGIFVDVRTVGRAIINVAKDNMVHAVREYLRSLKWDGEKRVDSWLCDYLGVERSEYSFSVGRMWLISAIARIMRPGCQADYMLVLEGQQGIKKSSALQALASQEWFCDQLPDLSNKDSQIQLFGSWIIEWAELDSMRRSDVTTVKSYITRRVEKLRMPHGVYTVEIPRQCIFAGTTNERNWMKDETGGRRFWPVWCEWVDIAGLKAVRDQLWAEAMALFEEGAIWWPEGHKTNDMLAQQQDERMEVDAWHEKISQYVDGNSTSAHKTEVTISEILTSCMGMSILSQTQAEKARVGRIMKALGWKYMKRRIEGGSFFNGYVRPAPKDE